MVGDNPVCDVLRAMEMLEGRVRATTKVEIGFLVPLDSAELDHVLCRAVDGGWVAKELVRPGAERAGVRAGTTVYRLTEVGAHRTLAA